MTCMFAFCGVLDLAPPLLLDVGDLVPFDSLDELFSALCVRPAPERESVGPYVRHSSF